MNFFKPSAEVEILAGPDALHVTVKSDPQAFSLLAQAGLIAIYVALVLSTWATDHLIRRVVEASTAVVLIIVWLERLSPSPEVIEFKPDSLTIRKERFGWNRESVYSIDQCTDLGVRDPAGKPHGLQCRVGSRGWRTIEFGDALSAEQATQVLVALQDSLPRVAQKLLPSIDITN
jgi:hypothetical protein